MQNTRSKIATDLEKASSPDLLNEVKALLDAHEKSQKAVEKPLREYCNEVQQTLKKLYSVVQYAQKTCEEAPGLLNALTSKGMERFHQHLEDVEARHGNYNFDSEGPECLKRLREEHEKMQQCTETSLLMVTRMQEVVKSVQDDLQGESW